jgi:transposase
MAFLPWAAVSKDAFNRYGVFVPVEEEPEPKEPVKTQVGIDRGLGEPVSLSTGKMCRNPLFPSQG